jgi:hypothetical protein
VKVYDKPGATNWVPLIELILFLCFYIKCEDFTAVYWYRGVLGHLTLVDGNQRFGGTFCHHLEILCPGFPVYNHSTPCANSPWFCVMCRYLKTATAKQTSALISSRIETMTRDGTMNRNGLKNTRSLGAKRLHLSTFSSVQSFHVAQLRTSCYLLVKSHNCWAQHRKMRRNACAKYCLVTIRE